jgi:predicted acyltransferase
VLFAAGWTLLILFLCYVVIDIKKHQGAWTFPWKVFGSNAIFAYAFSELLSTVLGVIHIGSNGNAMSLKRLFYTTIVSSIDDPSFASLIYSLSFVLVSFVACLLLYRKRIFIKI